MKFKIHPAAVFIIAFFIWNRFFAELLLSVFLHECGHAAAAFLAGKRGMVFSLSPMGFSLYAGEIEGRLKGLFILGAGPLVSLLLIPFLSPQTLWVLVFNLFPVLPLDGGRIAALLFGEAAARLLGGYALLFVLLFGALHSLPPVGPAIMLILFRRHEMSARYEKIKRTADFLRDLY